MEKNQKIHRMHSLLSKFKNTTSMYWWSLLTTFVSVDKVQWIDEDFLKNPPHYTEIQKEQYKKDFENLILHDERIQDKDMVFSLIKNAINNLWIHEKTRKKTKSADQYMRHLSTKSLLDSAKNFLLNTANFSWCGLFIAEILAISWFEKCIPSVPEMATSYIQWSWNSHVAFKIWDYMLWWNQNDAVRLDKKEWDTVILWYALPTKSGLIITKWEWITFSDVPHWAIVVIPPSYTTQ